MNDTAEDVKIPLDIIYIKEEPDPCEDWLHIKEKSVEYSAHADVVSENKFSSLLLPPPEQESGDGSNPHVLSTTSLCKLQKGNSRDASLVEEEEESLDCVTSAATTAPTTTPAANTGEGAMRVEDPVSDEPGSPKSPEPTPRQEEEEEEEQEPGRKNQKGKGNGKGKRKADGAPKQAWSLPDQVEQDLVEWLQGNSYLWLRSTKDYHRKKSAWEMKAQEIGVPYKHLQNWWKNVKDWYVKLSKKASGQAKKQLTDRDKWVLKNIAFYKSSIPTEAPDTLVSLPRAPSGTPTASSAVSAASTSHALPSLETYDSMESQSNILEEMELAAAEQGSTTSSRRCKSRRRDEESLEEESWMQELHSTMKANQALLEKLLEERSQAQSDREAFIRYVSDTLRTAPQEQYSVMKELITDIMR